MRSTSLLCSLLLIAGAATLLAEEPFRVSEVVARKAAVTRAEPDYPPIAKQMRISGKVLVDAQVGTDGTVEKVDVVSGNAILAGAAVAAARKWVFSPFSGGDGKPTKALVRLGFNFGS
jgi:protein TonB